MNEGKDKRVFNLEDRLIEFAVIILKVGPQLMDTKEGNHIRGQIIRCGTSPAPNYGEAESAESRADFIHKIKIVLKELRETRVWLMIIVKAGLISSPSRIDPALKECNELISIFVKSVQTARKNSSRATS